MTDGTSQALRRRLGLFETTVSGIGIILGAGIYALVGEAAGIAGNAVWISFLIAAAMAALTGLSYAELASAYPQSGADYEYTRRGLGARAGFVVGWLMVLSNLVGAAAVALGFGGYLATFFDVEAELLGLGLIVLCTLLAFAGVREAVWVSIVLTLIEASGLIVVIAIGLPDVGDRDLLAGAGVPELFSGAALVAFAFIGFSQVASLAEETVDAPRVIPRAVLISIGVAALVYVLVAVAAVSVLGAEALAASDAPLADVAAEAVGDRSRDIVAVIALFATANTVLLLLMASSRMIYGMASGEDAALPRFMAWVHPVVHTPARAIVLCLVVTLGFALSGDLRFVAGASNFAVFVAFIGVNLTLIVLRYRAPELARPFRVRGAIGRLPVLPALGVVAVAALLVNLDRDALLAGGVLFVLGIVASEILRLWKPRA
ncbi:MAG: amino acid permease [Dehalococcoidia bacterium]|nr:amino acid permease [Dehalococcoidia bacterium]